MGPSSFEEYELICRCAQNSVNLILNFEITGIRRQVGALIFAEQVDSNGLGVVVDDGEALPRSETSRSFGQVCQRRAGVFATALETRMWACD